MKQYNPSKIRTLTMLGQRGAFGYALDELASTDEKIFALTADLKNTSGLDRYAENHPERFLNVGIAEQNMIGVAAGLASSGYRVFAATFANFAALRACEFVRHFMGYMGCPVRLVGFGAGFAMEYFGNTHFGVEDIAALRSMSGITIVAPADALETAKAVDALAQSDAPAYLRLTGLAGIQPVYTSDYEFIIGKAVTLREGTDVSIVATGSMVAVALGAAEQLNGREISCAVVNMHTINPLDTSVLDASQGKQLLVTVEEHSTIGGLGSAVAEHLSTLPNSPRLLRLGIAQGYKKAGSYNYMLEQNGLTAKQIADAIAENAFTHSVIAPPTIL